VTSCRNGYLAFVGSHVQLSSFRFTSYIFENGKCVYTLKVLWDTMPLFDLCLVPPCLRYGVTTQMKVDFVITSAVTPDVT
jgi:hypothetical protein